MKALLIIDMQQGSFTPMFLRYNAEAVIEKINKLTEEFREAWMPVIFIQHDGSAQGEFRPFTQEWELLPELVRMPNDIIIGKTANDAFYETSLDSILKEHDVDELVITGCATDFCVDATVKGALSRDYQITVIKDGHTTANRPHITGLLAVDYFNMLWENMVPTRGQIKVESCREFLAENFSRVS